MKIQMISMCFTCGSSDYDHIRRNRFSTWVARFYKGSIYIYLFYINHNSFLYSLREAAALQTK